MSVETPALDEGARAADARFSAAPNDRPDSAVARLGALLDAGAALLAALRRVGAAYARLVAAEAEVLRASAAFVFLTSIALIALSVSLWGCAVALLGWLLLRATHSMGIALALLLFAHAGLVTAIWFAIKRAVRRAGFPRAREEFGALREQAVTTWRAAIASAAASSSANKEPEQAS